jgi:cell wall-associated NlpC family hydrolase
VGIVTHFRKPRRALSTGQPRAQPTALPVVGFGVKRLPSLSRLPAQRRVAVIDQLTEMVARVGRIPLTLALSVALILCTGLAAAAVRRDDQAQRHRASITAASTLPQQTTPAPAPTPSVAPLRKLVDADVLVTSAAPLSAETRRKLSHLPGVTQAVTFAVGRTKLGKATLTTYAVDPSAFRAWTAAPTARSDGMWQSVARGELTASFDAAQELDLPLGGRVVLNGGHDVPLRLGAIATLGLPGADAVVSSAHAHDLGLRPQTGYVLTAPHANLRTLAAAANKVVGSHALVHPLHALPPLPSPKPPKPSQHSGSAPATTARPQQRAAPHPTIPAVNGTLAQRLIAIAKSRIGSPYVYGAAGPNAFDCSGFTSWVFGQVGIRLPRTAAEQWNAGPHVSYAQAQPGDILAWASDPTVPGYVSHVAIYLGNGMMIAAQHSGTVVSILPVYPGGLIGAARFL